VKKKFRCCAVIYFIKKLTTIQYFLWLECSYIYILYACKSYYGDKCDELFFKWDRQMQWKRHRIDAILMLDIITNTLQLDSQKFPFSVYLRPANLNQATFFKQMFNSLVHLKHSQCAWNIVKYNIYAYIIHQIGWMG